MGCFQRQAKQMADLWVYAVCLVLSVIKLRLICSLKWRRTRTLQLLPLHILSSRLLIPLPCLLPLHFLLSHLLSHPVSTPLLVSHLLYFGLLSIPPPHPSQFLIVLFNSLISTSLNFLHSFTHVSLYFTNFWSSLASHLFYFDFSCNFSSPFPLFLHIVSSPLLIYWLLSPFFSHLLIIWLLSSYLISPPLFWSSMHLTSSSSKYLSLFIIVYSSSLLLIFNLNCRTSLFKELLFSLFLQLLYF